MQLKYILNKDNFLHQKNYVIICVIDFIFKILFKISTLLGFPRNKKFEKNKVLLIEPAHLGDALLTTPAIRFLKENRNELKIICLVSPEGKLGLINNKNIDSIYTIVLPWYKNNIKYSFKTKIFSFFKLVKLLREINPKTAINVRHISYHREHLAMWLAGIPERIGYGHKGFSYFLTTVVPFIKTKHIAQLKIDIMSYWLGNEVNEYSLKPDFIYSLNSVGSAKNILEKIGINKTENEFIIAINPGAQHNFLWKVEYYIKLCELINNTFKAKIIFTGTKNFKEYILKIQNELKFDTYSIAGMTTLEEVAAILKTCDLLITVDTGLRYIASAIGLKTIVIKNGADSILEFGKHVETEDLIVNNVNCSPCGKSKCPLKTMECMEGINHYLVFEKVKKFLYEK